MADREGVSCGDGREAASGVCKRPPRANGCITLVTVRRPAIRARLIGDVELAKNLVPRGRKVDELESGMLFGFQ